MWAYLSAVDKLVVKQEEVSLLRMALGDLMHFAVVQQFCAFVSDVGTLMVNRTGL